jgi:hypothetical protein
MHQAVHNMLPDTGTDGMIFCRGKSVRWSTQRIIFNI